LRRKQETGDRNQDDYVKRTKEKVQIDQLKTIGLVFFGDLIRQL
jgi:hypothetical protein